MENKKSPEADLEKYRSTWLLVGYVVALSALFVALEWTVPEPAPDPQTNLHDFLFEEELAIQLPEALPEPPPPQAPAKVPETPQTLTVVDNTAEVEETSPPLLSAMTGEAPLPESITPATRPANAQEEPFLLVDELPEFADGGLAGLMRYLTRHIRYPLIAQQQHLQGRVMCQFIVNADGSIADVRVMSGVHPALDNEATRVLGSMPPWKPGKLKGKPVRVRFTLPVEFRLR